jgi:uncharacterized SAM-binding protein YcdF (DUF218 family)
MSERNRGRPRWSLRILSGVLTLCIIYVAWTCWSVWHYSRVDEAATADAIVVLGAAQYNGTPSPVLAARLDHAAALWEQGLAPVVVVTGGKAQGDTYTEATASARYLGEKGVPDAKVLREVQGRDSWQSLQASARFMRERGIHKVILVSDSFHDARIRAMAKDLDLDPLVSPTRTSPIGGSGSLPYFLKEVAALGAGQIVGFDGIARLERNFG